jgi:hypothetical protein
MSPSSSDGPKGIEIKCSCGNQFNHFGKDWPPRFTICPRCHIHLTVDSYDPLTHRASFREIP